MDSAPNTPREPEVPFLSDQISPVSQNAGRNADSHSQNRKIVDFFDRLEAQGAFFLRSKVFPEGKSPWVAIPELATEIVDSVNLSTFMHRLGKWSRQSRGSASSIEMLFEGVYGALLSKSRHVLEGLRNAPARDIAITLYGLHSSSNVPDELFETFCAAVWSARNWTSRDIGMALYGLQGSSNVPDELFSAFAWVVVSARELKARDVGMALYGLQNSTNVPDELFSAFADAIPSIRDWRAVDIGMALYGLQNCRNCPGGTNLIDRLEPAISGLGVENEEFLGLQSLVIGLEHVDYEAPPRIENAWNALVEERGAHFSSPTEKEAEIAEALEKDPGLAGLEIHRNTFVFGYEVDIVLLDTNGKIFAIVEADGRFHNDPVRRMRDRKRDSLFYRSGAADLVIRVSKRGCGIVSGEGA